MSTKVAKSLVEKTKAEKEDLTEKNGEVKDNDLNGVTGGAFPTAVNNQITDSVT